MNVNNTTKGSDNVLKKLRETQGLSQGQLAQKTGISVRTLQSYEQGSRDINGASLSTLVDLAIALKCKLTDILSDQELIKKMSDTI